MIRGPPGSTLDRSSAGSDVCKRQGLLDGKSLADYSGPERARKMALMVPHTRRTELTTCFEMASAGRYPYTGRLGVLSAEDRRQVHAALALVGAEALAGRDFNCISDGQRQRVLLARAICQQPKVLLLDEPTGSLDVSNEHLLLREAKKAAQERHIAVLSSLHDLNQALAFGDRFFFLKDGAIRWAVTRDAVTEAMLRDVFGPELRLAEVDGEKVVLHRRAV